MAGRKVEPIDDIQDIESKGLRLELLDMVSDYTNGGTGYTPYMWIYEKEVRALVGLSLFFVKHFS